MITAIDPEAVYNYVGSLTGEWEVMVAGEPYRFLTRYTPAEEPIQKATRYAFDELKRMGYSPYYHYYELPESGLRRNVIVDDIGEEHPEQLFILSAHLDSRQSSPEGAYTMAPGADDNGTGSAALLMIADIFQSYQFDCTLRYILFTGEEQGYVGSAAYAADASANGDQIEAVINIDMIGYDSNADPIFEIHTRQTNQKDLAIADLIKQVIKVYDIDLIPNVVNLGRRWSDHTSFWDQGYPAVQINEDITNDFNPYFHTVDDRLSAINIEYFTSITQAVTGTFAHLGCDVASDNLIFLPLINQDQAAQISPQ
jgi:Zn-dependent M28 family amino/carboxypeptidase